MLKMKVVFTGEGRDSHGMPEPYHAYYIVSSPGKLQGAGQATVDPLSEGSSIAQTNFVVDSGGEKAALEKALKAIRAEPCNKGLKENQGI